jgi:glycosyltransferase involved in cell wall biosynthesis
VKFSVITPSYNQAQYLEATLESIHTQGLPVEHWVLDGGSTDGSVEILGRYAERGLLQFVSERDGGQADAVNKGFGRCTGDVICWLNSDDLYTPGALQRVHDFLLENPRCNLVTGDCDFIDANGSLLWHAPGAQTSRESMIRVQSIAFQPSTFFRTHMLEKLGGLDVTLRYALDYDFWLRMTRHTEMAYLPHTLSLYRLHQDSKSMAANQNTFLPEVIRVSRKHWGPPWRPEHWARRAAVAGHAAKVYYEAALIALKQREHKEARSLLLRALRAAPWKGLYWRDLLAMIYRTGASG